MIKLYFLRSNLLIQSTLWVCVNACVRASVSSCVCVCDESDARSAVQSAEVWLVQCISDRAFRTHNTDRRSPPVGNQHTCNGGVLTQSNSVKVIPIFSPHF